MNLSTRVVPAVIAVCLLSAAPASADGVRLDLADTGNYLYAGGEQRGTSSYGDAGACVAGDWYGVHASSSPGAPAACVQDGDAMRVSLPPAEAAAVIETIMGAVGGGEAPSPSQRTCHSQTAGAAATCIGTDTQYLLLDSPADDQGEAGVCVDGQYFFVAGPGDPDTGDGDACPVPPPPPPPAGPATPPPPPDGDADGVPDENDSCPATAGSSSNGCPPESTETTEEPADDGTTTTTNTSTTPTTQPRPAERRRERPRVDIARRELRVSRSGRVVIPIACRTPRTPCVGELRLFGTRRTESGRRVRVLVAIAGFHIDGGDSVRRRVRLTKAGREMLAQGGRLTAQARLRLATTTGPLTRRDRLMLRRR